MVWSSRRLFITGPNDQYKSEHPLCGVCECPLNLMLGPVIRTPLVDRMSIQLQFTLGNTVAEILFKVALNTIIQGYLNHTSLDSDCKFCWKSNRLWKLLCLYINRIIFIFFSYLKVYYWMALHRHIFTALFESQWNLSLFKSVTTVQVLQKCMMSSK
jgi:hypothetical protein